MKYERTSQYDECAMLAVHFLERPSGYFVDIGAADGILYSNTLNFINNNWSGILVEPCRHFITTLNENYTNHPRINIFDGAVSNFDGITEFYVWEEGKDSQISTIVYEQYESIKNSDWWIDGEFTDKYNVNVITPSSLLKKFNAPKYIEFVDIDAEASEMNILNHWPWDEYEVELFCIEFSMGKDILNNFMKKKGYFLWLQTAGNHFYSRINNVEYFLNSFAAKWNKLNENIDYAREWSK